ncbi:hypothetical protein LAD77_00310 [Klebsiella pneumoniae]|nr:hypothetical protein [Klebsiella pneumoniae]
MLLQIEIQVLLNDDYAARPARATQRKTPLRLYPIPALLTDTKDTARVCPSLSAITLPAQATELDGQRVASKSRLILARSAPWPRIFHELRRLWRRGSCIPITPLSQMDTEMLGELETMFESFRVRTWDSRPANDGAWFTSAPIHVAQSNRQP